MERTLPVVLTLDEIKTKGEELARVCQRVEDLKEAKKDFDSLANGNIKDSMKEIEDLATVLRDGREFRQVPVEPKVYWENNTIEFWRQDTGEKIETRAMTVEEREHYSQEELPINATDKLQEH